MFKRIIKLFKSKQTNQQIELLDIEQQKIKKELNKKNIFGKNVSNKFKLFSNKNKEEIEVLDFDEQVKYEKKNNKKMKLPKIKNRFRFAIGVFVVIALFITVYSFIPETNVLKMSAIKFFNGLGIYTVEVRNVEMQSNNYNEPGSWHIDKSAEWIGTDKAKITFDVNSVTKAGDFNADVILVIDISGSMEGEKLYKAISDSKELVNFLLSNRDNRVAIVTFESSSTIVSELSNDKEELLTKLDSITTLGNTNYNAALQNVDVIMNNYIKESNRDVITLFLTDGYPNEETPNQIGIYEVLKDKYPYMKINGVQYEMGVDIIDEIKEITDSQWVADRSTLNNVLFDASISPTIYEDFIVTDYIQDDYFKIESVDDIKVTLGTVKLEEESESQKIIWNLGKNSYRTGSMAKMEINVKLKEECVNLDGLYPTNKKESVNFKLPNENEKTVSSSITPVLKNNYEVVYDTNAPAGCTLEPIDKENYFVYQNVTKKTTELSCDGYLFKGWEIDENDDKDIKKVNGDVFVMPFHDVTIRATWVKHNISKAMDGTVYEKTTLYRVLKNEAKKGTYAKEYTGEHQDSMDQSKSTEKIYHWYADNDTEGNAILDMNNVIFAGHCWQMIRTTDTGGVKMIYNGKVEDGKCLSTRGNHVGIVGSDSEKYLDSYYVYGASYTYDEINKTFTLKNIQTSIWSDTTYKNLLGKYTCMSSGNSCSTLYYVNEYCDSRSAYVSAYTVGSSVDYSQIGTGPYNKGYSLTNVGYKHGNTYKIDSTPGEATDYYFSDIETMLYSSSVYSTYWYSNSISYNSGRYNLVNPYEISPSTNYSNLIGKYTFKSTSKNSRYSYVYYIVGVKNDRIYYKKLESGKFLSSYEPMVFGESITENSDGTYSINNRTSVWLDDWITDYNDYKGKYTCGGSSTKCSNPRYISYASVDNYSYINAGEKILIAKQRDGVKLKDTLLMRKDEFIKNNANNSNYITDYIYTCGTTSDVCTESTLRRILYFKNSTYQYAYNYYWSSSVTWDGTNYTLVDPIGVENYHFFMLPAKSHYMCLEKGFKTCSKVAYVYYYESGYMYYILLENGEKLEDAYKEMMESNRYDSSVKGSIDAWYEMNMLDYSGYLEDTIFCNDRSASDIGGWNPNGGPNSILKFKGYNDYDTTNNLSCTNVTDRFSVSNPNAKLKYKVGLMTRNEMNLLNRNNIRSTGKNYWLITPYSYWYDTPSVRAVCSDGSLDCAPALNSSFGYPGVRPAISLKPGIEYSDGDGSMQRPYLIELE